MRLKAHRRNPLSGLANWPAAALLRRVAANGPWLAASLSLLLFVGTLSRDITWSNYSGDGGELITASMTLGVAHPPGYPLYIVIGRIFGALPLGTVAARYALLSAVAGAAAIGLSVHAMTVGRRTNTATNITAAAIGLALAVTPLLWGQAIVAEVYALFLFFVALFIWSFSAQRSALLIGLTLGLAVASHLTGFLLLPLALWRVGKSGLPRFLAGALVGLSPFLLLPWLATGPSPLAWGNLDSPDGWWWLVSARLYRPNVLGLPPSMWVPRLANWLNPAVLAPLLLWLISALAIIGRPQPRPDKRLYVMLITALLYAFYAFTYRPKDSLVLLLPAFLLLAVVVGRGLSQGRHAWAWLLPLAMLGLGLVTAPARGDPGPLRSTAVAALTQAPPTAIVLTPGDATVSTLWYLHHVEGLRPDIVIVDRNMFQFDWYRDRLKRFHSELWLPAVDDLGQFIAVNRSSRPVCQISLVDDHYADECLPVRGASLD